MKAETAQQDFSAHNQVQRSYFESLVKPTMVPTDTPYVRRHVDEVIRFAQITPGQRVLEVGCGMGRYTLMVAARGISVEGLDLSPVLLERLRAYDAGRFNVPLHEADIWHPPENLVGAFDAVIGFFTLHHLHDLTLSFQSMARLVKPGGRITFLEPNAWNPLYYLQIAITPGMTWEGDRGIVDMTRKKVFGAMREAGLTEMRLERFGFFPPAIANQPAGATFERLLESVPPLKPFLPFQLMGARRAE